jgi:hypothetical protein
MMFTLTVDLKIPIETEPLIGAPALTFSHWLPLGKNNGISISEEGVELNLWFDLQSTWWASEPSEEELKKHVNVLAHYVRAEVTVRDISADLAAYMQGRDFRRLPDASEEAIQSEYERLGGEILRVLLNRTNRLISYARSFKGQYWLLEYRYDVDRLHGYFQTFEARGRIDAGDTFRFQPSVGDSFSITMTPEDKFIRENEWLEVTAFVTGERGTPLVFELLAGAEQLAGNGYTRSALTEAVTALEVALSTFGRLQNKSAKLTSLFGPRLGIDRLQKQIEHMGLSGTMSYLLPLLPPDSVLTAEVLSGCREAIDARQNVVHNGQREVHDLDRFISCIKACCKVLRDYSDEAITNG